MSNLDKLRKLTQELEYKIKLANIIETVPDVEMYQEVTNLLKEITNSTYGAFGYIDAAGNCVCPAFVIPEVVEDCKVKPDDVVYTENKLQIVHWCRVMKSGVAPFYNNNSKSFIIPEGHIVINNFLLCPIIFRNKCVGVLGLANKIDGYTDNDLEIILQLANYIAPVLSVRIERDMMVSLLRSLHDE